MGPCYFRSTLACMTEVDNEASPAILIQMFRRRMSPWSTPALWIDFKIEIRDSLLLWSELLYQCIQRKHSLDNRWNFLFLTKRGHTSIGHHQGIQSFNIIIVFWTNKQAKTLQNPADTFSVQMRIQLMFLLQCQLVFFQEAEL
jgi:hypothetical protein